MTIPDAMPPALLPAPPPSREQMIERLYARYGRGTRNLQFKYFWKKYAYLAVINGTVLVKRVLDIALSVLGMAALSPVFLVVAALIKLTDGGAVFYVAPRVGQFGREFSFPKFRSMCVDAAARKAGLAEQNQHGDQGVTFKMRRDPRVTRIGAFIRKTSIDELPQLWCVLKGDMSLVGPRPPLPEEVARYTLRERRRLDVKPGLTCLWQVSGRGDLPFAEQVRLDLAYMESQSLALDLWLLACTVPAVLFGRGAY